MVAKIQVLDCGNGKWPLCCFERNKQHDLEGGLAHIKFHIFHIEIFSMDDRSHGLEQDVRRSESWCATSLHNSMQVQSFVSCVMAGRQCAVSSSQPQWNDILAVIALDIAVCFLLRLMSFHFSSCNPPACYTASLFVSFSQVGSWQLCKMILEQLKTTMYQSHYAP